MACDQELAQWSEDHATLNATLEAEAIAEEDLADANAHLAQANADLAAAQAVQEAAQEKQTAAEENQQQAKQAADDAANQAGQSYNEYIACLTSNGSTAQRVQRPLRRRR